MICKAASCNDKHAFEKFFFFVGGVDSMKSLAFVFVSRLGNAKIYPIC